MLSRFRALEGSSSVDCYDSSDFTTPGEEAVRAALDTFID
jgi:hypothetical protein